MTAGRQVKRVDLGGGKYNETVFWKNATGNRNSITLRNHSNSGQLGDFTIDVNMQELRGGLGIELKFLL